MKYLISIDTSINKPGFAVHEMDAGVLVEYGVLPVQSGKGGKIHEKLETLADAALAVFSKYEGDIEFALIERAEAFSYSRHTRRGKGITQAAMNINHNAVGVLSCLFHAQFGPRTETRFVTPEMWKGKKRKEETVREVNMEYQLKLKLRENDIADAIGIGRWALSGYKFYKKIPGMSDVTIGQWYDRMYGEVS